MTRYESSLTSKIKCIYRQEHMTLTLPIQSNDADYKNGINFNLENTAKNVSFSI